jgi:hypothetical protein
MNSYQDLMTMVAPVPQMNAPMQSLNPMAMAQALRGRMPQNMPMQQGLKPRIEYFLNKAGSNFGLNSNQRQFNVGLNPNMNRSAYLDFLNSMSGG